MIEGPHIHLRTVKKGDDQLIFIWENNPEYEFVNYHKHRLTRNDIRDWIVNNRHDLLLERQLRLMVCKNDNHEVIGCVDLFDYNQANKSCGIGIIIEKKYRKMGYGFEAINYTIRFIFQKLGLNKIESLIHPLNTISIKFFEKSKFKFIKKTDIGLYLYLLKNSE